MDYLDVTFIFIKKNNPHCKIVMTMINEQRTDIQLIYLDEYIRKIH